MPARGTASHRLQKPVSSIGRRGDSFPGHPSRCRDLMSAFRKYWAERSTCLGVGAKYLQIGPSQCVPRVEFKRAQQRAFRLLALAELGECYGEIDIGWRLLPASCDCSGDFLRRTVRLSSAKQERAVVVADARQAGRNLKCTGEGNLGAFRITGLRKSDGQVVEVVGTKPFQIDDVRASAMKRSMTIYLRHLSKSSAFEHLEEPVRLAGDDDHDVVSEDCRSQRPGLIGKHRGDRQCRARSTTSSQRSRKGVGFWRGGLRFADGLDCPCNGPGYARGVGFEAGLSKRVHSLSETLWPVDEPKFPVDFEEGLERGPLLGPLKALCGSVRLAPAQADRHSSNGEKENKLH